MYSRQRNFYKYQTMVIKFDGNVNDRCGNLIKKNRTQISWFRASPDSNSENFLIKVVERWNLHVIFLRMMRCSLWRSIFFNRISEYRKTDCIHVNWDVYDNTSEIKEGRQVLFLFPRIANVSRYVIFLFHIFFVASSYIRLYIRSCIRSYMYYKEREKKYIINTLTYFYLKNSFAITSYIFSIHFVTRNS